MVSQSEMEYIQSIEEELQHEKIKSSELHRNYGQTSMFSGQEGQNLIQWQLDLNEELERIEHLLKGHIITRDNQGNENWTEPKDDKLKPFNDYGVQLILNVISFYLNRNTILSNYSEPMINWKMEDLGEEVADLIFLKYDEMGMNTKEKRKLYSIIVRQIVDTIHSAYLRSLHGGERESLRTARHVSQSDNPMLNNRPSMQQSKKSIFKPWTYLG